MKPHEETWIVRPSGGGMLAITSDTDGPTLLGYDPRQIGVWPEQDAVRVAIIAAAPEMARALLSEFGSFGGGNDAEWHTNECWDAQQGPARQPCARRCTTTRALLVKAGVLP